MTRLLLLPGDGVGPEIVAAAKVVMEAAERRFDLGLRFDIEAIGLDALEREGTTMPENIMERARTADGIVLGPVSHNVYPPAAEGGINPSARLRTGLDLYANIRPARTKPGLDGPISKPVDLVIFRENTEGFYADRNMASGSGELLVEPDLAIALRKISRRASARIAEAAFRAAEARPDRRVTAVHKANVLRTTDGLFLDETRRVASNYRHVEYEEVLVDAMAALLVREPHRFDVIVTTNMFGDILSDLASELSGGLGLAASLNQGTEHAMAQAQHGSAPDLAGQGIANPAALIGSVALLFRWIGQRSGREDFRRAATRIEQALDGALSQPSVRTPDLGGTGTTEGFGQAVAQALVEEAA